MISNLRDNVQFSFVKTHPGTPHNSCRTKVKVNLFASEH
jgi:hypothetical protein